MNGLPPPEELARLLGGAKKRGTAWLARCPAHDDHDPSLHLKRHSDGVTSAKCLAGCDKEGVWRALVARGVVTSNGDGAGLPPGIPATWKNPDGGARLAYAAHWPYLDASGKVLGFDVRFNGGRKGKQVVPFFDPQPGGKWKSGHHATPRPLYGLDKLAARPDAPVILCEGCKAADAAQRHLPDHVAASWCGGTNSVQLADLSPLAGRDVAIWPDNDAHGRKAAQELAERCREAGAASVVLVNVEALNLPPKGDAADLAELPDGELPRCSAFPVEAEGDGDAEPATRARRVIAATLSEFLAQEYPPVEEIIPGLLAAASHTLPHGAPGLGKSQLAAAVAVSTSSGVSSIPAFEVKRRERCLYIDGEQIPRLVQDRFRIHLGTIGAEPDELNDYLRVISRIGEQARTGNRLASLATPAGREWLLRELDAFPAKVIFLDTVRALMRHPEHSLSDEEGWRPCEELLAEMSARGIAVVYLHHDGKNLEQLGTSAREHDPSYILHLTKPKKAGLGWCRFRLEETKGRLGPSFAPVELVLEPDSTTSRYAWCIVGAEEATIAEQILRARAADSTLSAQQISERVRATPAHVRSVLSKARRASA